jgi:hypothetical protein
VPGWCARRWPTGAPDDLSALAEADAGPTGARIEREQARVDRPEKMRVAPAAPPGSRQAETPREVTSE